MKRNVQLCLGALSLAGAIAWTAPALAVEGLSANGAVTSNYIFRGISQSGANPAVSAGLDFDAGVLGAPGFSVGTWFSSIDFGNDGPVEWDLYGGYTGMITDQFTWSLNVITYNYPNMPAGVNFNWQEYWFGLNYNFGVFSLAGKIYYSPDYTNLSVHQIYYNGAISIPIAPWLSLNGSVGFTDLSDPVFPIIKDYTDYGVSLAATFQAYTITVGYTGTDIDGAYEITSGPFETDDQFFVSFSFKFM